MIVAGGDLDVVTTQDWIDKSTTALGTKPLFWGRYFKGPGNTDPTQYQPQSENALIKENNIKILPTARQTNHVNGTEASGRTDGSNNVEAVIAAFGADYIRSLPFQPLIFLDVEGTPPLSLSYYKGWATAIKTHICAHDQKPLGLEPAVYNNISDEETWRVIGQSIDAGIPCFGAWTAHYPRNTPTTAPDSWSDANVWATRGAAPCKLLAWQYVGDYMKELDFNILNPAYATDVMNRLILPS